MRNNLNEIIKERLENRHLWRSYLGWLLTHKDLSNYTKREFYKEKPFLALIAKFFISVFAFVKFDSLR